MKDPLSYLEKKDRLASSSGTPSLCLFVTNALTLVVGSSHTMDGCEDQYLYIEIEDVEHD